MASSVNLGERLESAVTELVKAGRYGSRSEVLREGVRLVQEREARLALFDRELAGAVESIERGQAIPVDEAFDRLDAHIEALIRKRAA